jgi:hypothetical protein
MGAGGFTFVFVRFVVKLFTSWNNTTPTHVAGAPYSSPAIPSADALFGAAGYGHLMGRIGGPYLVMQAIAPLVLAFVAERTSDPTVLALVAAFAAISFIGFVAVRRPKPPPGKA